MIVSIMRDELNFQSLGTATVCGNEEIHQAVWRPVLPSESPEPIGREVGRADFEPTESALSVIDHPDTVLQ